MLARVADSLFWMGRYLERAEDTARLADVQLAMLLELESLREETVENQWRSVLRSFGDDGIFEERGLIYETRSVAEFLTFDRKNPSSVISCVYAARENARMIRDQISSEMWEVVNRLYLFLKKQDPADVFEQGAYGFFRQVKEFVHLFSGVTDATFPRKLGYDFLMAGAFLERAVKTGQVLDLAYHRGKLLDNQEAELEASQWVTVLRGCAGLEAYHRVHVGEVVPARVVEFLVRANDFPRSILFCLNRLQLAVHKISGCPVTHYTNEAERLCGRLISEVLYSSGAELADERVHEFLVRVEEQLGQIAGEFSQKYMFFPIIDPATGEVVGAGTEE